MANSLISTDSTVNSLIATDSTTSSAISKVSSSVETSTKSTAPKTNASSKASSMTSVKSGKTAFQIFDAADKKMDLLTSYSYQDNFSFNMKSTDLTVVVTSVDNVKCDTVNNQKRFTVEQTTTTNGEKETGSACYNGKYYVKQEDGSYAEKSLDDYLLDFPDVLNQEESDDMPDLLESDIIRSTKGTYAGGTIVTIVVKGSKISTFMESILLDEEMTGSVHLEDVTIKAKINNNGYYEELSFNMKGQISLRSTEATLTMSLDGTYQQIINNPGKPVTVTLPVLP